MIIIRTKTDKGITTFPFVQVVIPGTTTEQAKAAELEAAKQAASWIMRTTAAGFMAEVDSEDSTSGKILEKWDHRTRYGKRDLWYQIKYGPYKDDTSAVFGTEEQCLQMAEEINKKSSSWWDTNAYAEHVVGSLWQCVIVHPFTD